MSNPVQDNFSLLIFVLMGLTIISIWLWFLLNNTHSPQFEYLYLQKIIPLQCLAPELIQMINNYYCAPNLRFQHDPTSSWIKQPMYQWPNYCRIEFKLSQVYGVFFRFQKQPGKQQHFGPIHCLFDLWRNHVDCKFVLHFSMEGLNKVRIRAERANQIHIDEDTFDIDPNSHFALNVDPFEQISSISNIKILC